MNILIPLLMLVFGVGAGVGAGLILSPDVSPPPHADDSEDQTSDNPAEGDGHAATATDHVEADNGHGTATGEREYAKLNNQFVVPIVADGKIAAMVVMSISLEITAGSKEAVFLTEPKLRDGFLQVLFDHANVGGFSGNFTDSSNMRALREALLRNAQATLGPLITDVLIIDMVRQDS